MAIIDENWNFYISQNKDIESKQFSEFELQLNNVCEHVLKLFEDSFLIQNLNNKTNLSSSYDEELKVLNDSNKELRQEVDFKLKALTQKQDQYECFRKDQKLLSQEIKETHEAFLMAKKYYKKFFKFYYTVESRNNETQTIFVQFFTEAKKETDNYSMRLVRNFKTAKYELLSTNPKLKNLKELQKKLQETNDVPGGLCCIRQAFLNKKTKQTN